MESDCRGRKETWLNVKNSPETANDQNKSVASSIHQTRYVSLHSAAWKKSSQYTYQKTGLHIWKQNDPWAIHDAVVFQRSAIVQFSAKGKKETETLIQKDFFFFTSSSY